MTTNKQKKKEKTNKLKIAKMLLMAPGSPWAYGDTQFIIIVDNDTMVYIIYPKCDDAIVHQIAEIYYGIHNIPTILLCYIITKYHHMLPRYL